MGLYELKKESRYPHQRFHSHHKFTTYQSFGALLGNEQDE